MHPDLWRLHFYCTPPRNYLHKTKRPVCLALKFFFFFRINFAPYWFINVVFNIDASLSHRYWKGSTGVFCSFCGVCFAQQIQKKKNGHFFSQNHADFRNDKVIANVANFRSECCVHIFIWCVRKIFSKRFWYCSWINSSTQWYLQKNPALVKLC